jgi:hypothetical protein
MSPPDKRKPGLGTRADATTRPDLPPSILDEDADEEQLTLWPDAIPAHRLHPAEADMRRVVNLMPRPKRRWVA